MNAQQKAKNGDSGLWWVTSLGFGEEERGPLVWLRRVCDLAGLSMGCAAPTLHRIPTAECWPLPSYQVVTNKQDGCGR